MRALAAFGVAVAALAGPVGAGSFEGLWRVVAVNALVLAEDDNIFLTLVEGQISGNAGCNRFSARFKAVEGLTLGPVALTRMLCVGRAAEIEAEILDALPAITGWQIADDGALVFLADESVVLRALPEQPE